MKIERITDIKSLPIPDRIQLVEDIWDSIAVESGELPLTDAQKKELDRRLAKYHLDPQAGSAWADVRDRITR
ncbi:MAG: addiction module protein [Candidatus Marinimicrobia bacterium]|nr:addiction module protein [Candidatus Neomarinimicrobiota bacterium]